MRGGPYDESVEAMFVDLVRVTKQQMSEGGNLPSCGGYYFRCKWINGWCTNGSLYCTITCSSEVTPEPLNGRVLTFSSTPAWHEIEGKSLQEKVDCLKDAPMGWKYRFSCFNATYS